MTFRIFRHHPPKRLLIGLVLLGWLAITLFSCTGFNPRQTSGRTTEIEFWTMQLQPKFTDYFNQLIHEFETANPSIQVRWVDVPWSGMESKILTSVVAKTPPDVVNLNPNFASQLAGRGAWLSLDDRIPADVRAQYLPKIWQASQLDGQSFGIPWYLTTRIAIVNQALLKTAGVETPPANFKDLFQAAETLHTATGKYAFFSTLVASDAAEVLESLVQQGVTLVNDDGTAAFNTPTTKAIFANWVKLYQNGWVPKEVLTEGQRYGIDLFQRGESAVVQASPGFLQAIAKNAPSIAKNTIPASQLTGKTGKKNVAVMNLVIPRDTDQPDAAVKFALFITNNTNQLSFAKAANVLPSTQAALKDPYFSQLPANPTVLDQARIISAEQLPNSEVLIPVMRNLKQLQKLIYENLQAAALQQKSVDQALNDAELAWNHLVIATD
ncbi:sugar ABC transporter substrate-binding protein [filamentous cyanobacterium LEGE 11480]|uniref:Sugar ABC transporter substrate-binding protein n=1 Tax=Romeriopsis navalis LEGE 11480 TaxID=2777977 RepID=A0A928VRQ0_9CYAN|nr:sugar ABC transporter substrate-binding protein [Romeriopsis navalis]MBE9031327.1 sugar ABC transporter substrate-binding protein [Romeriopsis navalis LEGE 11480]